jgi:hypothetical protein
MYVMSMGKEPDLVAHTPFTPCHTAPPTACAIVSMCSYSFYDRRTYTHGESATKVIEDDPGTRVARMVHAC